MAYNQKKIQLAEDYFLTSITYHNQLKEGNSGALYSEFGNLYYSQGKYHKALQMYKKGIAVVKIKDDLLGVGYMYLNKGLAEVKLAFYEEAIISFEKSLNANETANYNYGVFYSCINLAKVYALLDNYKLSFEYLDKAAALKNNKLAPINAEFYATKAEIYLQKNNDSATFYMNKAIALQAVEKYDIDNLLLLKFAAIKKEKNF